MCKFGYGGVCYKKREFLEKRAVATHGYLNMMRGAAGLSAIAMSVLALPLFLSEKGICTNGFWIGFSSSQPPTHACFKQANLFRK